MKSPIEQPTVTQNRDYVFKRRSPLCAPSSPIVTVIVQCYNRTTYLENTVTSVRMQTFTDYDLIIFDNGSTQEHSLGIEAIADKYQASYLRAIKNGQGDNIRRLVLPLIHTEYTAVLHDDDMWKPEKLANAVKSIKHDGLDYVFSSKLNIDAKGNILHSVDSVEAAICDTNFAKLTPERVVEIGIFRSSPLHWSSIVIRSDILRNKLSKYAFLYRNGDWQFFCYLVNSEKYKGRFIATCDTLIRVHEENDFSYNRLSKFKMVLARSKQMCDEIYFFHDLISYPLNKFVRIFERYFQDIHNDEHANRYYIDLSMRFSERSGSWCYFSKLCLIKAMELNPDDTHEYLLETYQVDADLFAKRLDMTFYVRLIGHALSFLPPWVLRLALWLLSKSGLIRKTDYIPPTLGQPLGSNYDCSVEYMESSQDRRA